LDRRLVRGGTSTPNFSVQDGVQPLFQSAASPLSDRSFSSDVEPSPVAAFIGPLLEPLLEFAARHVPIPFCPVPSSNQSLLDLLQCMGLHRIAAALFDPGQETTSVLLIAAAQGRSAWRLHATSLASPARLLLRLPFMGLSWIDPCSLLIEAAQSRSAWRLHAASLASPARLLLRLPFIRVSWIDPCSVGLQRFLKGTRLLNDP